MNASLEIMYSRACDKVERGDVDEARKILKGNPELLASLDRKIKPPNEAGILKEVHRLAKLAAFHRGRAWVYQLEATQVCHYSRTLLKDPQNWFQAFLDRQELNRPQVLFIHARFYDYYHEDLVLVREIVHSNWIEYKENKPKGVRFKDFTQFKALVAPHEFNPQPKIPSRYERAWVI